MPVYQLEREEGADHAKKFYIKCIISDVGLKVIASGNSHRKAEQAAATEMLIKITRERETG